MTSTLDILPSVDLGIDLSESQETLKETAQPTVIKIKPIYEITSAGCQCLGFIQYKLDGFDSAAYMNMLSNPETMQAIKEIYYSPKESTEDIQIPDRPELQLEY